MTPMSNERILKSVEKFLAKNDMAPTTFGRKALNDPHFVSDLRDEKRRVWPETAAKLKEFMSSYRREAA